MSSRAYVNVTATWAWYWERLLVFAPWLLLATPTLISQLAGDQSGADRALTLGLVAVAGAWVYGWHTRATPERRESTAHATLYFAGLLVLFVVLMNRDMVYLLFTITGFFHAFLLHPWPLGVAGVFGTSVALNTMTLGLPDATAQSIGTYVGVIAIQTAAIGMAIPLNEKSAEYDRHRDEMVARLEAALEENAGLHAQLLTQAREAGVLDERQRMAREIHDTLAQGLTGIITQVQAAQRLWHEPERARPHLDKALHLARDSLTEARQSVQALHPRELDQAHLPDALRDMAKRWADGSDVELRLDVTGDRVPLSPAIEITLFRVAQEALTNVAKHAKASRVGVTLSYVGDVVLLDVRDDGVGMTGASDASGLDDGGFGLNSMRQRVRGVGGSLEIESAAGEGTAVSASVPAITVAAP